MEFGTAGPEEGTEQGVDAVGVVILILRMLGQRTNEIHRRTFSALSAKLGAQRQPLVI